jgi:hypothetical protein
MNNGDVHTRVTNGKIVQEDKHTINVITPAPGQSSVTTYSSSYSSNPSTTMYVAHNNDFSNNGDVKVRVDRNGTVVQSDRTTINKIKPAPADVATLSNGYVMVPAGSDVRVTTDSKGNIIQTDKTTINKITPMPSSMSSSMTTVSSSDMNNGSTTTTTTTTNTYGSVTPDEYED